VVVNLAYLVSQVESRMTERKEWLDKIRYWKEKFLLSSYERADKSGLIKTHELSSRSSRISPPTGKKIPLSPLVVAQHQLWTAQRFHCRHPRTMITSGGLGTMGYGLPAAIGAKVARPDALVIDIDGDASFNMTLTEMSTAAQFNIGVRIIVLNNEEQGMVTQ
jgi:acetolactate synthase-1/2/3 large subunit